MSMRTEARFAEDFESSSRFTLHRSFSSHAETVSEKSATKRQSAAFRFIGCAKRRSFVAARRYLVARSLAAHVGGVHSPSRTAFAAAWGDDHFNALRRLSHREFARLPRTIKNDRVGRLLIIPGISVFPPTLRVHRIYLDASASDGGNQFRRHLAHVSKRLQAGAGVRAREQARAGGASDKGEWEMWWRCSADCRIAKGPPSLPLHRCIAARPLRCGPIYQENIPNQHRRSASMSRTGWAAK